MLKAKIFNGYFNVNELQADVKFNEWMDQNPEVEIKDFIYRQARGGCHSICILYDDHKRIANEQSTMNDTLKSNYGNIYQGRL